MVSGQQRYQNFLQKHQHRKVLYLELGIGANTPVIIKYPFWNYVSQNKNAVYISINLDDLYCPENIHKQSILIQGDIHNILNSVAKEMRNDHDTK